VLGYPIRTSSDPRSVDNSPRHIAASHVLHRPLMPRHPPCALTHLHTQKTLDKKHTVFCLRCSQPLSNTSNTTPHHQARRHHTHQGVLSQNPTVCPMVFRPDKTPTRSRLLRTRPPPLQRTTPHGPACTQRAHPFVVLLRKEVIQPHLPVRLPCYDFVPIADPTFDSSPQNG
jgi:hypothetical protein